MSALSISERSEYEETARVVATMKRPPLALQEALFNALAENREVTPDEADGICEQILNQVAIGWGTLAKAKERGIAEDSLIEFGVSLLRTESAAKSLARIAALTRMTVGGAA